MFFVNDTVKPTHFFLALAEQSVPFLNLRA
jgi:hypothetical protein